MGRAAKLYTGFQRMVTNGDVIYVHQFTPRPNPAPAAPPEIAPEPAEVPVVAEAVVEEEERFEAPPHGYAYEFETGRLVPIRPDLMRAY